MNKTKKAKVLPQKKETPAKVDTVKLKPVPKPKKIELTPEQEYLKLVEQANKEDPCKEPIKDLIDKYADIAEQNSK